jgi:hypothetical protein
LYFGNEKNAFGEGLVISYRFIVNRGKGIVPPSSKLLALLCAALLLSLYRQIERPDVGELTAGMNEMPVIDGKDHDLACGQVFSPTTSRTYSPAPGIIPQHSIPEKPG